MTIARDWFADEHEFRQLCGDAQSQARGESSQDFAAEMVIKANEHGLQTYLSPKQLEWLCKLADWDVPKRRAQQHTGDPK
ncbi:MAG: hypothetical protein KGJ86_20395 [Chloroflexota bacterium]|nr:hypothetical protein [Chloroflexota bacterium]